MKKKNQKRYLALIQRRLNIFKKKSTCLFSTSTGKKLRKDVDKYVFGITDCGDFCKVTRLSNSIGVQAQVIQYVFHETVS